MSPLEIDKKTREIRKKFLIDLVLEAEKIWGQRVHAAVCLIPIDESIDEPAVLLFSDTNKDSPHMTQLLALGYTEKLRVQTKASENSSFN